MIIVLRTLYEVDIGHVDSDWVTPGTTIHGQGSLGLNLQDTGTEKEMMLWIIG